MDASAFTSRERGIVSKTPGKTGYLAFFPRVLPSEIPLGSRTVLKFERANSAVARLSGIGRLLPNPDLLIAPHLRVEAVLSSRIEGTQSTISDLLRYEAAEGRVGSGPEDVVEVSNYVKALRLGLRRLDELPISLRLIRELHAELLSGVRGRDQHPGEFRRTQNWIGPSGCLLEDATFVPPPVDEMKEALHQWEVFVHEREQLPLLVQLALAHYQFEVIHPFLDGNGRVGRLLIPLILHERGALSQPLLYLSAYLERNRPRYYELLLNTSQQGNLIPWIEFFLEGVAEQASDAESRTIRLVQAQEELRNQLLRSRASTTVLRLADHLFAMPYISATAAQARLSVTAPTARKAISELVRRDVLTEVSGAKRGRLFFASQVHEAVYGDIDQAHPQRRSDRDPYEPAPSSPANRGAREYFPFA